VAAISNYVELAGIAAKSEYPGLLFGVVLLFYKSWQRISKLKMSRKMLQSNSSASKGFFPA